MATETHNQTDEFVFTQATEVPEDGLYYPCGLPVKEDEAEANHMGPRVEEPIYEAAETEAGETGLYYPCGLPVVEDMG